MSSISCPKCKTQIEFDFNDIMKRKKNNCSNCDIKTTLSYKDNKATLLNANKKLDMLKDELGIY
jgi:hypothetical protein